jgi:hypothetical protein
VPDASVVEAIAEESALASVDDALLEGVVAPLQAIAAARKAPSEALAIAWTPWVVFIDGSLRYDRPRQASWASV